MCSATWAAGCSPLTLFQMLGPRGLRSLTRVATHRNTLDQLQQARCKQPSHMSLCCPQEKECALSDLNHQLQQVGSPQAQLARLSPAGPSAAAAAESTGTAWQVALAARDAEIEELHCELMEVRGSTLFGSCSTAGIVRLPLSPPPNLPTLLTSAALTLCLCNSLALGEC